MTAASMAIVVIGLPCAGPTCFTITRFASQRLGELVLLNLPSGSSLGRLLGYGVFLALAETVRRWGNWPFLPFLLDDWIAGLFLAHTRTRREG